MLFLRRGELCRAGQEASGKDLTVGLVKVNDRRAAFSVQRQPGGDGLPVAAFLRRGQRLRGKRGCFAGKSGKRAVRGVFALGGRQAGGRMGNGDDPWTVAGCDQEPEFV